MLCVCVCVCVCVCACVCVQPALSFLLLPIFPYSQATFCGLLVCFAVVTAEACTVKSGAEAAAPYDDGRKHLSPCRTTRRRSVFSALLSLTDCLVVQGCVSSLPLGLFCAVTVRFLADTIYLPHTLSWLSDRRQPPSKLVAQCPGPYETAQGATHTSHEIFGSGAYVLQIAAAGAAARARGKSPSL